MDVFQRFRRSVKCKPTQSLPRTILCHSNYSIIQISPHFSNTFPTHFIFNSNVIRKIIQNLIRQNQINKKVSIFKLNYISHRITCVRWFLNIKFDFRYIKVSNKNYFSCCYLLIENWKINIFVCLSIYLCAFYVLISFLIRFWVFGLLRVGTEHL